MVRLLTSLRLAAVAALLIAPGCIPLADLEPATTAPTESAPDADEPLVLDGPTYSGLGCHAECEIECGPSGGCYDACVEACNLECHVDCDAACWDDEGCYTECFDPCVHPEASDLETLSAFGSD